MVWFRDKRVTMPQYDLNDSVFNKPKRAGFGCVRWSRDRACDLSMTFRPFQQLSTENVTASKDDLKTLHHLTEYQVE